MFKINDLVMYGLTGVCQVIDIGKDEYVKDDDTQYYVLEPVYATNMTIRVPVQSQKVMMRPIISKDEALALIASLPAFETLWADDDRQRNAAFQAALRSGKSEEWIRIIRTLYLEKEARTAIGKRLNKIDDDVMTTAEKLLNQEFAAALNILPEEVIPYILEHAAEKMEA